ncbi:MAG: PIG-L family deacetylase [Planctomycetota bacterium]|jgi:LmbE family N-acetylglucosaminyl deacetylase|nr:PIG-L family deacetylase [Planctomycetota bacterium]
MAKTILAIGAHYDDCPFGIPGILLKAVRKNYRVVLLSIIGDYTNWKPIRGRADELIKGTQAICQEYGAEMRFLPYASMRYDVNQETKRAVAEVVADVQPDIAFNLWPHDRHADHEVASQLGKVALAHGDRVLENPQQAFRRPGRVYSYDNGPRHTIGFEPNTFVDVSDEWPQAIDWLGRLMALVRNEKYDATNKYSAQQTKENLARYRGMTAGVKYAEAVRSIQEYPREIFP